MLEGLETRRLLDAELANNTLTVTGSDFADNIRLIIEGSKLLLVMSSADPGADFRSQYAFNSVRRVVINCGNGNDVVEIDQLYTRSCTINGGIGSDTLTGALGHDFIDGGEGNDFLDGGFDLGLSSDTLIGGLGAQDTANYSHHTQSLKIDLDGNADDGAPGERDNVDQSIERVIGGGAGDEISSNLLVGVTLIGNGGNDTLSSSGGNDFLSGGNGRDFLISRGGNDLLRGGADTDTMIGGTGVDTADYSDHAKDVTINLDGIANDGQAGENDLISSDIENLTGGNGNDSITGSNKSNQLFGGEGNDTITALDGPDSLSGGGGNDLLDAGGGDDTLDGGTGADIFIGGAGIDLVSYRFRSENLIISVDGLANDGAIRERDDVRSDNEIIEGGSGADSVTGSGNSETILGNSGNDTINGGAGDDRMEGGPGNDVLDGGLGADQFIGGPGTADVANYTSRIGNLLITVDDMPDDGESELDNVATSVEIIRCGSGNDQVFGSTGRNTLEGNGGDDLLFGDAGNDSLDGGDGNDTLDGDRGADIMVGGPDIDTGDYSQRPDTQRLVITLDNLPNDGFNETDNLMSDIEIVLGGAGNDRITAGTSPIGVSLQGNEGDDTLNGGNANDSLEGGAGNDSLLGAGGNDTLRGGDGDDRLNALDLNNDTVDGGDGDDEAQTDFVDLVIDVP